MLLLRAWGALSPGRAAGDAQEIYGVFGAPARQVPESQEGMKRAETAFLDDGV